MEVKHKECFIPNIVKYFGLAAVSKYAREAARVREPLFAMAGDQPVPRPDLMTLDLLAERPEVASGGFHVPALARPEATGSHARPSWPTPRSRPRSRRPATPTWRSPTSGARRSTGRSARSSRTSLRSRFVRESLETHGREGRRDGRLGDARRGARAGVGGARPDAHVSP